MSKSNRMLTGIIVVLSVALLLETGYLMGKHSDPAKKTDVEEVKYGVPQTRPSFSAKSPSAVNPSRRLFHDPFFRSGWHDWDPFEEMARMQEEMNRTFQNSFGRARHFGLLEEHPDFKPFYQPNLDMNETDQAYLVKLDLPGIEKNTINIKVQEHSLTISGQRSTAKEESDEEGGFYRFERSSGAFSRTIPLPEDASRSGIKADMDKGVLTVTIPKQEEKNKQEALFVEVS